MIKPRQHETLLNAYDRLSKVAQSKSLCNVAFSVIISEWNDMIRKEMDTLVHDKGINSFIIDIQKDQQLFEVIFDLFRSSLLFFSVSFETLPHFYLLIMFTPNCRFSNIVEAFGFMLVSFRKIRISLHYWKNECALLVVMMQNVFIFQDWKWYAVCSFSFNNN